MKNKHIKISQLLLLAVTVLFYSCYKDNGNYDYTAINKLTVTDTASATRKFIVPGDTLRLTPVIKQTLGTNEDSLTYFWSAYDNSSNSDYTVPPITLATTRNLNYVMGGSFTLGQDYRLTLKVTDKITGVSAFVQYDLTIANKFAQGWMLFEDKSGAGDIAMILPANTIERNVYSDRNKANPLGKPVALMSTQFSITDDMSAPGKRIYLLTENDGQELNGLTMIKKFDYGYLFFAKPAVVKPSYQGWTGYLSGVNQFQRSGVAINDGKIYTNLVGGFPGIKKWGEALITPAGNYNYNIAPYIAGGVISSPTYATVVYDNIGKRFYVVGTTSLTAFPTSASNTVFDMNNVGLDLVSMDSASVSGTYNAIMKDATNNPFLLQFKTTSTVADPVITMAKIAMNAPGIAGTKLITTSTLTPHIYYAIGNKINKYETTSNTYKEVASLPAGETVTKVIYQKYVPGTAVTRLVVSTWNGTEGKVYYYNISNVGDLSTTYTNVFTGFARIVDMAYKYP